MTMELVPAMMITLDLPVLIAQVKGYLLYPQALRMVPRVWNHFYKVGPIVIGVWPLRLQHQDVSEQGLRGPELEIPCNAGPQFAS